MLYGMRTPLVSTFIDSDCPSEIFSRYIDLVVRPVFRVPSLYTILLNKPLVEFLKFANILIHTRTQACQSVMPLSFLLPETASRDDTDPSFIKQTQRVKDIWLFPCLPGRLLRFL